MNRLFFVLLFFITSLSGFAQSKWGYGITFSPDAVSETHRPQSNVPIHYKLMIRYTAGANIFYNFNKRFALISGLWFSERGISEYQNQALPGIPNINHSGQAYTPSYRYSEDYLELPVLLKFGSKAPKRLSFYATFGIVLSAIVNERYRQVDASGTQVIYFSRNTLTTSLEYKPIYFLATIGRGVAYQLNDKTQLAAEANLKYSLNTLYNTTPISPEYRTHEYSVGIRFGVYRSF